MLTCYVIHIYVCTLIYRYVYTSINIQKKSHPGYICYILMQLYVLHS